MNALDSHITYLLTLPTPQTVASSVVAEQVKPVIRPWGIVPSPVCLVDFRQDFSRDSIFRPVIDNCEWIIALDVSRQPRRD